MLRGCVGDGAADGAEVDECEYWRRLGRTFVGAVRKFRAPDMKVGLRDRFMPAEGGDVLSARGMSCQVIAPGRFFLGLKFHRVPLRVIKLKKDCVGLKI